MNATPKKRGRPSTSAARSERLLRAARAVGAQIDELSEPVVIDGETYTAWTVHCRSNEHAIQLLNVLADLDAAEDGELRSIAEGFLTDSFGRPLAPEATARNLHRYVQETVEFVPEQEEAFRSAALTLILGQGDCDDSAHLLASLAKACGMKARVVGVRDVDGEIGHVCAQIYAGGWQWAECTFEAGFGEEPRAAARRLGILREDLA